MKDAAVVQLASNQVQLPSDLSSDGRLIAYDISAGEEEREVWLADVSRGTISPLLHGEASQGGGAFSPDGKRIAFVSDESSRAEVYLDLRGDAITDVVGEKQRLSTDGAWLVRWRPDGQELFYVGIDNWLHAVPMTASSLPAAEAKSLFRIPGTSQYGSMSDFQLMWRGMGGTS